MWKSDSWHGYTYEEGEKEMEEKKAENLDEQNVTGGAARGFRGGYCPYTEDRSCRMEIVGSFDNDNEICKECGYRAW